MSNRATCWSITINNPTQEDIAPALPAGWKLQGQIEKGEEGTEHFQGMLCTPQVRFSAVKRHLPRAHIEIARNKDALQAYVHKDETRVREVQQSAGLTVFALQDKVLELWNDSDFKEFQDAMKWHENSYLWYADCKVRQLIANGVSGGIEYVAINPMWRTSWKKFGESIVQRYRLKCKQEVYNAPYVPQEAGNAQAQGGEEGEQGLG